jgi:single-strand DNA-binding protein
MSDTLALTGLVATTPRHLTTAEGLAITSFRLASSQRRFDRGQQKWIDADTNWYTVSAFRALAANTAVSVVKGDRVIVTGRLRIRDWENTDRSGTTVEIEADTIGHDMFWGTSQFTRVSAAVPAEADPADSQDAWQSAS